LFIKKIYVKSITAAITRFGKTISGTPFRWRPLLPFCKYSEWRQQSRWIYATRSWEDDFKSSKPSFHL